MADTQVIERPITADTRRWRLTADAVQRLMQVLDVTEIEELGTACGFSRQTFWRLRTGEYDIRMSEARRLADIAGWSLTRMFEETDGA